VWQSLSSGKTGFLKRAVGVKLSVKCSRKLRQTYIKLPEACEFLLEFFEQVVKITKHCAFSVGIMYGYHFFLTILFVTVDLQNFASDAISCAVFINERLPIRTLGLSSLNAHRH
jgi:hypothetical protein